jgi:hypothetical protein
MPGRKRPNPPPDAGGETLFWQLADPLLERAGVTQSTMMGYVCLRVGGEFFATVDRRSGSLVVKLDEPTAANMLATGQALPFAPYGKQFREWVSIPAGAYDRWELLLHDALTRAAQRRPPHRPPR